MRRRLLAALGLIEVRSRYMITLAGLSYTPLECACACIKGGAFMWKYPYPAPCSINRKSNVKICLENDNLRTFHHSPPLPLLQIEDGIIKIKLQSGPPYSAYHDNSFFFNHLPGNICNREGVERAGNYL